MKMRFLLPKLLSLSPRFGFLSEVLPAETRSVLARCFRNDSSATPKWSYSHGASSVPLINKTIGQLFQETTEKFPDRDLFVFSSQNIRKTYSEVFKDAERLASGLLALGVKRGDRVGMWGPNSYEWTVTQFGTAMAGMTLVTINPAYQVRELNFALQKVGVTALISTSSFKQQDFYGKIVDCCPELPASCPGSLHSERLPFLKQVIMLGEEKHSGTWSFEDILKAGDSESDQELRHLMKVVQPDEAVNIQFTSGTTGVPKGATLSHFSIINNAYFIGLCMRGDYREKMVIVCPPQLYHCYGCVAGSLLGVVHESTVIFPSPSFQPLAVLQAVHNERATHIHGTPTMFIDFLNHAEFENFDYSSMRGGTMGGSPCPVEVCKSLIDRMNMKDFVVFYGSTEMSPIMFCCVPSDPIEKRVETVGRVMPHLEGKVVDGEGNIVEVNETGEVMARGYCAMLGYWSDQEKTQEVLGVDRWYRTGDLGKMDEEGYLQIVGRTKDMIVRGGENIYPTEIEQVLYTHPKVADVQVLGVPDDRLGEQVCAWIRLRPGETASEQEIKDFCRQLMAPFKIPRYVLFKNENEFPMTITGKYQKFMMRDISTKELGLEHLTFK